MVSSFSADPEVKTIVLLTYPRGQQFKCYNNQSGWFGHIRDYKPHLFYRSGQWYVVNCGVHFYDHLKPMINERNNLAYKWACLQNATEKERQQLFYRIRRDLYERDRKLCP